MPTILESLLFEIGIDTKNLKKDAEESDEYLKRIAGATEKTVELLEEKGKKTGNLFKGLKEEAGGFFSMIAGAYSAQKIVGMSKDIMLNAEALGFMSSNLGMATERLKVWQLAAEKNGGSNGSMNSLLNQAAMVAAATKRGEDFAGSQEFFGLGGKQADLQSPEAYLMAVSRIIKAQYANGEQAGLYSANALSVPPDLVFLLKQGPEALQEILKGQEKYAEISKAWAEASHDTLNSFRNIGDNLTKIGTIMLESVNPELRKMAEYAERAADAVVREKAAIKENTPIILHEAGAVVAGKAIGKKIVVTGGDLAGTLAGKSINLGGLGGPLGAIVSDLLFPKSIATDEQAKEAWMRQNGGGGDMTSKQRHLADLEKKYGLPPGVLDALWAQESGRGKSMLSSAGAKGHFQFMDATRKAYGDFDPNDFDQSSDGAARYMRDLLKQHNGDLDSALRWYNAGGNYRGSQAGAYSEQVRDRMPASASGGGRTDIQVNGPITIQTQSTDAAGIKKEFADSMGSYSNITGMAETGTH